jgi:hypothetical protein
MLSAKTTELRVNLYVTVGGNEDPHRFLHPFRRLVKVLEERHSPGFSMQSFLESGKDRRADWEAT